jgi:hypothetical protein
MNNEHDDDKRPLSERIKDDSFTLSPEMAKLAADHFKGVELAGRLGASAIPPAPAKELVLSQQQIEAIAEAVANRVVAKLKEEPK